MDKIKCSDRSPGSWINNDRIYNTIVTRHAFLIRQCSFSQVGQAIYVLGEWVVGQHVWSDEPRISLLLFLLFSLSNVERLNGGNSSSSSWRLSVLRNYPLWETALLVDRNQFSLIARANEISLLRAVCYYNVSHNQNETSVKFILKIYIKKQN